MATPADQRLLELLEKWLKSLELHLRYSSLDNDSYSKIQPWPEHQRPSRWIIDLAMQKAVTLRFQIEERIKLGDSKFSDSLELMTFLANLIGSEHIERFIPLADPASEILMPTAPPGGQAQEPPPEAVTATREMPEFVASKRQPAPVGTAQVARTERKQPDAKPAPRAAPKQPAKLTPPAKSAPPPKAASSPPKAASSPPKAASPPPKPASPPAKPASPPVKAASPPAKAAAPPAARPAPAKPVGNLRAASAADTVDGAREQVMADAARLVQWGRKWYELAELIARMADRPSLPEVRRILKDNKTAIEKKAGRS
jgi:hypothetical protein